MDKLWKWVMHLNAKAFCLLAVLGFVVVAAYCGWQILHPPAPLQDGGSGSLPTLPPAWQLGTLDFVTNQLTAESLTIPVDPFRPTIEAIFTNETERAAFLKALKAAQNAAAGLGGSAAGAKKEDPFAHLRKKDTVPGGLTAPDGTPMVIPKLSFLGFMQRPDGKKAAMFQDSTKKTPLFFEEGKQIHGVDVVSANAREAEIRFADGTSRKLPIGESVSLAAEPDLNPPPKKVAPVKPGAPGKPGAQQQKPGAQQQKPGAKGGAGKPGQLQRPQKPKP